MAVVICPECEAPARDHAHDCPLAPCWCCGIVGDHQRGDECRAHEEDMAAEQIDREIKRREGG